MKRTLLDGYPRSRRSMARRALAAICLAGAAFGQEPPAITPEARFQEAWYREAAEGRIEEALAAYEALAASSEAPAPLRARALLRAGLALSKLGRTEEARKTFARVVEEYAAVQDVARRARRELAGETEAEASFRAKVEGLVKLLGHTDRETRSSAQGALSNLGTRAAPALLEALGGGDFYTVQSAGRLLVDFAALEPELAPAVLGALRSGDAVVQKSILSRLSSKEVQGEVWSRALDDLLRDPSPALRSAAAGVLGARNAAGAVDGLAALLTDAVPEVRAAAASALGELADSGANAHRLLGILATAASDPEPEVRAAAVKALGPVVTVAKDPGLDVVTPLLPLLGEATPHAAVIGVLQKQQAVKGSGTSIFPRGEVGQRALARLGEIAGDARLPLELRRNAAALLASSRMEEAVPVLLEAVRGGEPQVAFIAAGGLVGLGGTELAPVLLEALEGRREPEVRKAVWIALVSTPRQNTEVTRFLVENLPRLGDRAGEALESLFRWNERRDLVVAALPHFAALDEAGRRMTLQMAGQAALAPGSLPEALPVVVQGLADGDSSVRLAAAAAAAHFPDPAVVSGLVACLKERADDLRGLAARSLGNVAARGGGAALAAALKDAGAALVSLLGEANPEIAESARNALAAIGDRTLVPALLKVLSEPSLPHPMYALDTLERVATPADGGAAARLALAIRADLRARAVKLAAKLASPEAVEPLRSILKDPDPLVRAAAVEALAAAGGGRAAGDLVGALADPAPAVRQAAAAALLTLEPAAILAQPEALPRLAGAVRSDDFEFRERATEVLIHLRDRRAAPALLEALRLSMADDGAQPGSRGYPLRRPGRPRPSQPLSQRVLEALRQVSDRSMVPAFLEVIADPTSPPGQVFLLLREHATREDAPLLAGALERLPVDRQPGLLELLGQLENPEVIPAVSKQARSEDSRVRAGAVLALGSIGGPGALPPIVAALSDPEEAVRAGAATVLGKLKDPEAVPALLEALAREESSAVSKVVEALAAIGDPRAIPAILARVTRAARPGPQLRDAVRSLGDYPADLALPALRSLLEAGRPDLARAALQALGRVSHPEAAALILQHLRSPDAATRRIAASVLGSFYDAGVLSVLTEALKDPDEEVRKAAKESVERIRFYLEQRRFAGEAGRERKAVSELIEMLADADPAVRLAAVRSLARLRAREALAALVRLRKDPDTKVRDAVNEALDAIASEAEER